MAKIGIDARLYGPKHTGIGRYVQNLVVNLTKLRTSHRFYVFGPDDIATDLRGINHFTHIPLRTSIYGVAEQTINPFHFLRHQLDLLHVPHFNAPLIYPKKYVITIHDLIKHQSVGPATTTLPKTQYLLKHQVYKGIISYHAHRANHIIVPSFYWKEKLISHYHLSPDKISVTYEAVDDLHFSKDVQDQPSIHVQKPFLVYCGNLYPHKNVNLLIRAVDQYNHQNSLKLTLALVGSRSAFVNRLPQSPAVVHLGYLTDAELHELYSHALALVQPSLIEGFGLTGLEAMASGLPVISSSASCLPEIYQDAALYFDPYSQEDLVAKISQIVSDKDLRLTLKQEGFNQVKLYSWRKMAKQTLEIYDKVVSS